MQKSNAVGPIQGGFDLWNGSTQKEMSFPRADNKVLLFTCHLGQLAATV